MVDYCRTQWESAVEHSGDILERRNRRGLHRISIDLSQMPQDVTELFITLSSFAGALLSDIQQPYVYVVDDETGMDLCEYQLEDQSQQQREAHTSVIMMKVYRQPGDKWAVQAIGEMAGGSASDYDALETAIEALP